MELEPLSEGDQVRVLAWQKGQFEQRKAEVVRAMGGAGVNLIISLDGPNDAGVTLPGGVPATEGGLHAHVQGVELVDSLEIAVARGPGAPVCFRAARPAARKIDPLLSMTPGGSIPPGAQCMDGPAPTKGGFTPRTGGPGQVGSASFDELPPTPAQRPPGHSGR